MTQPPAVAAGRGEKMVEAAKVDAAVLALAVVSASRSVDALDAREDDSMSVFR